jgi:hypothetical protein
LTDYGGWRIYTHVGKVAHNEIPDLKRKIRGWFDKGEWEYKDNSKTSICFESIKSKIEVLFAEQPTNDEITMGLDKYGVILNSGFFDWGWRNEHLHQRLCDEISHKITWQKQAYLLIDSELRPVRKTRVLRMKKE